MCNDRSAGTDNTELIDLRVQLQLFIKAKEEAESKHQALLASLEAEQKKAALTGTLGLQAIAGAQHAGPLNMPFLNLRGLGNSGPTPDASRELQPPPYGNGNGSGRSSNNGSADDDLLQYLHECAHAVLELSNHIHHASSNWQDSITYKGENIWESYGGTQEAMERLLAAEAHIAAGLNVDISSELMCHSWETADLC
jgi:hypothetical protein